jgi:undecaprenyl diphosphate synthase
VDLVIRTGGERRLSDFLLWESAYAELVFMEKAWPDFVAEDLESAVREFSTRDRRFGGLPLLDPVQQAQPRPEERTGS